ncbi:hypothetical protein I3J27_32935 [Bradyrhizobium xenonodulans]|uniref:Uncharacterized protein n=1 Tax=Bradyrhizobium xenonodulans TaxID=2736875 RepID=A0ABY7MHD3_9BRAD|nr:hypothetical protein [Bradyrhizobium xenonodulans]WBL77773.1 hypothetical protein I3J27_32935 [Bradyrhizobium xenonodulans]
MMFPVSAAILDNINAYQRSLESYSVRLLPFIKWKATGERSVRVLNETADFQRFFDATATPHAEFLYEWRGKDNRYRSSGGDEISGILGYVQA